MTGSLSCDAATAVESCDMECEVVDRRLGLAGGGRGGAVLGGAVVGGRGGAVVSGLGLTKKSGIHKLERSYVK